MAKVNGIAAASAITGLVFIWSGIKGASVLSVIQSLIKGDKPSGDNEHSIDTPSGGSGDTGSTPDSSGTTAVGGTAAQNQAIAKLLAAPHGWSTGAEWDALVWLWQHESGWNNKAKNPSSGAYGIPQALPGSKMGAEANPPTSSASAQIKWGLSYIKGRYGSPTKAKAFWQSHNWY